MQFKDIFKKQINSKTKQERLDIRKKILKKMKLSVEDILNMEINFKKKESKFN